jgi:molecular chaperone GrpE
VHQQALTILADLGYPRRDGETGKAFDPAHHEAVSTIADDALVPGTVAHVVRPGYGSDDQILRPASVVVATRSE